MRHLFIFFYLKCANRKFKTTCHENFASLDNTDIDIQESRGKDTEKNVNILIFKAETNTILKEFATKLHYTKYTVLHSFLFSFH